MSNRFTLAQLKNLAWREDTPTVASLFARGEKAKGRATYKFQKKINGTKDWHRESIGTFPDMTIIEAEEKAQELRKLCNAGINPKTHNQVLLIGMRFANASKRLDCTESEAVKEAAFLWRKLLSIDKRHLDYDKHVYALAFLLNQFKERQKMGYMSNKKYLKSRNGYWYFYRRLPAPRKNFHRVALKTTSLKVAQQRRDKILEKWDEIK